VQACPLADEALGAWRQAATNPVERLDREHRNLATVSSVEIGHSMLLKNIWIVIP
jgi:hypothetical protein